MEDNTTRITFKFSHAAINAAIAPIKPYRYDSELIVNTPGKIKAPNMANGTFLRSLALWDEDGSCEKGQVGAFLEYRLRFPFR